MQIQTNTNKFEHIQCIQTNTDANKPKQKQTQQQIQADTNKQMHANTNKYKRNTQTVCNK